MSEIYEDCEVYPGRPPLELVAGTASMGPLVLNTIFDDEPSAPEELEVERIPTPQEAIGILVQAHFEAAFAGVSPELRLPGNGPGAVWPETDFTFDDKAMLRGGHGHTERTRLMAAAKSIQHNPIAKAAVAIPAKRNLDESLRSLRSEFLEVKVKWGEGRRARQEILPIRDVLWMARVVLEDQRDPIIQYDEQERVHYKDELSPEQMDTLLDDLILSTKNLLIRGIYMSVIRVLRPESNS